ILVKSEIYFDRYDMAFLDTFSGIETTDELLDRVLACLRQTRDLRLTEEEKKELKELDLDEVLKNFERQLIEQRNDRDYSSDNGGSRAIGTSGTSTQGAWGYNPAGIRIGQGISRNRRAVQVAERRAFKNYASDRTLDTRQMKVALSHLRSLLPAGAGEKLDMDATIDATCKNAGEIELVWEGRVKKGSKVILFMDVGGSMTPYSQMVEQLFSAAAAQISRFKHFYFHNCIYQSLRTDMAGDSTIPTLDFLKAVDTDYKVIIVGDAEMAPSELTWVNGAVDYWYYNDTPGIVWLQRLRDTFPGIVWLNPLSQHRWKAVKSVRMIQDIFPMFELTLEGLDEGIRFLMQGKSRLHRKEAGIQ
ncbi:MAG: VWA domain-containing protein, partial [Pseudomonadota bacterium]